MEGHRSYFCGCAAKPNPKGPKWKASGPTCVIERCKWKASGPTCLIDRSKWKASGPTF